MITKKLFVFKKNSSLRSFNAEGRVAVKSVAGESAGEAERTHLDFSTT